MLGCQAELTRGVVLGELADEGVVLVVEGIVKADARADKDVLDARNLGELAQE